jgi:hypothetical protein
VAGDGLRQLVVLEVSPCLLCWMSNRLFRFLFYLDAALLDGASATGFSTDSAISKRA